MNPNEAPHPHHVPWLSLLLAALALAALVSSSEDGLTFLRYVGPYTVIFGAVFPGLLLVCTIGLIGGLVRYFFNPDPLRKKHGLHLALWSLLAFFILAAFWVIMRASQTTFQVTSTDAIIPKGIVISPSSQSEMSMPTLVAPNYYPYGEVPATDTREFLKTDYHATMRTRQVQELTRRAETTVRGSGGRVDQTSSSPKSGYVRFVIPASKFEAFRDEIESFVSSRYLSVTINSENLLPQKQSIEEQQKSVEEQLADLQAERKTLVANHTSTIRTLQSRLNAIGKELGDLNLEASLTPSDSVRYTQIIARVDELSTERANVENRIANENASYRNNLDPLDAQIEYVETNLKAVKTQDQKLLDTVATVTGTITLQWISIWEIVQLYVPGGWIAAILGLAAIAAYWWERRRLVVQA